MSTLNATNCIHNSADQNKTQRMRELRSMRGPRTDLAYLPDVTRHDWPEDKGRLVFEDMELRSEPGHRQWLHNLHKGELTERSPVVYKNVGWTGPDQQMKWGMRGYNPGDLFVVDNDFTEIKREHGMYVSTGNSSSFKGCTFLRVGSQGIQIVNRPVSYQQYDADNLPPSKSPSHIIEDSHFIDCGYRGDRPSYNASYFDPGSEYHPSTVKFTDSSWVSHWATPGSRGNYSTGAFVITQYNEGDPDENPVGSVVIQNCLFDFTGGDRSIGNIRGAGTILIEDSCFIARAHKQPWIDVNKDSDYTTEHIFVKNCRSRGVKVRVWNHGEVVARVDLECPGGSLYIDGDTGTVRSTR